MFMNYCLFIKYSQLGSVDFGMIQEGRSRILTFVPDGSISCSMEVGILKLWNYGVFNTDLQENLKIFWKFWNNWSIKIIVLVVCSSLGECPECVVLFMVLGAYQGWYHWEHSRLLQHNNFVHWHSIIVYTFGKACSYRCLSEVDKPLQLHCWTLKIFSFPF